MDANYNKLTYAVRHLTEYGEKMKKISDRVSGVAATLNLLRESASGVTDESRGVLVTAASALDGIARDLHKSGMDLESFALSNQPVKEGGAEE